MYVHPVLATGMFVLHHGTGISTVPALPPTCVLRRLCDDDAARVNRESGPGTDTCMDMLVDTSLDTCADMHMKVHANMNQTVYRAHRHVYGRVYGHTSAHGL